MFYAIRHLTRYRYSRPDLAEHDGSADAPAQRDPAALLHLPAVGEPARADLLVPGSPRQPGASLRSAAAPPRAVDRRRLAGQPRSGAGAAGVAAVRGVGASWRAADRRGRPLADADAEPLRAQLAAARRAGARARRRAGRRPRSADAGARRQRRHPRRVRLRAQEHRRELADRGQPQLAPGRLPGLRPHHDRGGARAAAFRAATSAAISITATSTRTARPKAPPTPGSRRCCPGSAGSASIRPTT